MASTRDKCLDKVGIVLDYCESHGMFLNAHKTQSMVINGSSDIVIEHCEKYTYLIFTADGSMNTVLTENVKDKSKHLLKLIAFFQKNKDFPFYVKAKY